MGGEIGRLRNLLAYLARHPDAEKMAMSLHHERRRISIAYQWLGNGELHCHDCTPPENHHEMEFVTPTYEKERCVQCGRPVGSVTVETWATVEVEYVKCKIF